MISGAPIGSMPISEDSLVYSDDVSSSSEMTVFVTHNAFMVESISDSATLTVSLTDVATLVNVISSGATVTVTLVDANLFYETLETDVTCTVSFTDHAQFIDVIDDILRLWVSLTEIGGDTDLVLISGRFRLTEEIPAVFALTENLKGQFDLDNSEEVGYK